MPDNDIDILIPYNQTDLNDSSIVMIVVRPESNKIDYESVIIKAASGIARPVYMANLNGKFISKNNVILNHYACQHSFATQGKTKLKSYPKMVKD